MEYLVGRKNFELKVERRETPEPAEDEVLVRVLGCGVCGTDLHFLRGSEDWTPLGHEISGRVEACGSRVRGILPGAQVTVEDVAACGRCEACQNGDIGRCTSMITLNGQAGMSDFLCVPERLVVLCDGLDPLDACFVEPLTVCVNAVMAAQVPPRGTLVVWGLGPLGLMSIRVAKLFGAGRVLAVASKRGTERSRFREALALEMGADEVLFSSDADFSARLNAAKHGRADSVLVTSPPVTLPQAVASADYGTRIVPIGIDLGGHAVVPLDVDQLILNKKSIVPMLSEPEVHFPLSVKLLRSGSIPTDRLLTHRIPLRDTERFRRIFAEDPRVVKAVVVPEGAE